MNKVKWKNTRIVLLIAVVSMQCFVVPARSAVTKTPKDDPMFAQKSPPKANPMIIWYHNIHRDSVKSLKTAISSGIITHVMIKAIHRDDYELGGKVYEKPLKNLKEALAVVKNAKLKLIWSRPLWPLYAVEKSTAEMIFDPDYYINEINIIRKEAKKIGADMIALDQEAYAYTPTKKYLRGKNKLGEEKKERLRSVISHVIKTVGQVDISYPAGVMNRPLQPTKVIAQIGKSRISTTTYYDNQGFIDQIDYDYEIFGVYLDTVKTNKGRPDRPLYLVREAFEKSHRWSNKKGLFLYPREHRALQVARELVKYTNNLPVREKTVNQ